MTALQLCLHHSCPNRSCYSSQARPPSCPGPHSRQLCRHSVSGRAILLTSGRVYQRPRNLGRTTQYQYSMTATPILLCCLLDSSLAPPGPGPHHSRTNPSRSPTPVSTPLQSPVLSLVSSSQPCLSPELVSASL